jgi:hypothetical protein
MVRSIPFRRRLKGNPYPPRLLRRFLRNRIADPTGFDEKRIKDWLDEHWERRRVYEYEDFRYWDHWQYLHDLDDLTLAAKHFEIRQFLRSTRARVGNKLFDASLLVDEHQEQPQSDQPWLPIEERLLVHVESLFHHPEDSDPLRESFENSPFRVSDVDFIDRDEKTSDFRDMLAAFLPFWIRSPRTCIGRMDRSRILAHVFAKHPDVMPKFASAFDDCTWLDLKPFVWLILIGYHGSLQRGGYSFHWRVPNKFQFALERIDPSQLPGADGGATSLPKQAIALAEVVRLGGNVVDACRLLRHPAYFVDPSDFTVDETMLAFWSETVKWMAAHRDQMDEDSCWQILDWAMHEFTERCRLANSKPFRWKGRTVGSTAQLAARYRAQLASKEHENKTWPARNLSWTCEIDAVVPGTEDSSETPQQIVTKWRFVELTSGKLLQEEGADLRHCVGGYWGYCMNGASSIVSLRRNGQRRLTIEITPTTLEIRQVRGSCNRMATDQEMKVIHRWHREWVRSYGIRREAPAS